MFGQLKLSVCRTALASNQALVKPLKQLHVIVLVGLFEIKSAELYLLTRVFPILLKDPFWIYLIPNGRSTPGQWKNSVLVSG